jgi:hypothetical protein
MTIPYDYRRVLLIFAYKLNEFKNLPPELLVKFNFLVSSSCTRNSYTFYTPFHRTNYAKNAPITRLMCHINMLNVDLFICNNIITFNAYLKNNVNIV